MNVLPLHFEDKELTVGILDYKDHDQLRTLREEHRSHVFYRDAERILCVPVAPAAPEVGEVSERIRLKDNLGLTAALARNALIDYLHSLGRTILQHNPLEFVSNAPSDDLLPAALPRGVACPTWLSARAVYELNVRAFFFDKRPPFVGLALAQRTIRRISASCAELLERGVPLEGLYVGHLLENQDARVAPYFQLLGCVESVSDGWLHLTDNRPELDAIEASDAYPASWHGAFDRCLDSAFGEQADEVRARLEARLADFRKGSAYLQRLESAIGGFRRLNLEMAPDVEFKFGALLAQASNRSFPKIATAAKTVYVFNPAGTHTDTWHDRGLDNYGPYTAQTFTPSRPRICIICQKTYKGQVEQFLHKFIHGIPSPTSHKAPFAKGFVRKYALDEASTEFFLVDGDDAEDYRSTARRALDRSSQGGFRWDLVMVQIEARFHSLWGDRNPYLVAKAAFLAHQIPVQEFEIETAELPEYQLGYVLNNMALAAYAKLGGIPWLIKANPTIAHEFVVGLGSASVGEGRLGDRERVVGITNVFKADGNYWLSNISRAVPVAEYQQTLLSSLRSALDRVRHDMNWLSGEHVRLVFHAFKPMKDAEAEAVKALVSELGDYDVEYAFVHVVEDHPYTLFDRAQRGIWVPERRAWKGALAPTRGQFLRLSNSEVLVVLAGARELKRPEDGMPRPVLLRLHRTSTFEDMTYLTRQVFAFSSHSWRSFFPAPMPVTILYSELIAALLGKLAAVSHWNPDMMFGRIGETRWFL